MDKSVDYIIVGQGLAGSVLAYVLLKNGKRIHVFDDNDGHTSSKVAAGLYNPITGRKMVKTWNADAIFPEIEPFYRELEEWTGRRFLHPMKIYRPFINTQEQNEWQAKSADEGYSPYIETIKLRSSFDNVHNDFGGLFLRPSGYVDIPVMLEAVATQLLELEVLTREEFKESELTVTDGVVQYGGIKANKVVFCTGVKTTTLFGWLPFRLVKGEVVEIKCETHLETIVNRGVFIIPRGNNHFKVGSTYIQDDLTPELTDRGIENLTVRLKKLLKEEFTVIGGLAGVRPATADRRPFIGLHPKRQRIGIFNGFGTKGVSLSPYYASQFFRHLEYGEELDQEVNIKRYFSLI